MKSCRIEIEQFSITICINNNERYNKAAIVFFGMFASLISLFPILAVVLFLSFDDAKILSFVIVTFFSTCVAFYLWRLILWNIYGKEIVTISKDRLTVINDYRFFKEKSQDWRFDNLGILSRKVDNQKGESSICIKSLSNEYVSNILIDDSEIANIKATISNFLKTQTLLTKNDTKNIDTTKYKH